MAKSKPQVRIDSLRNKVFSLPHAGNPEAGGVFEVDEEGNVFATVNAFEDEKVFNGQGEPVLDEDGKQVVRQVKVGRKRAPLTEEQADAIVQLRHLDGAVRVG